MTDDYLDVLYIDDPLFIVVLWNSEIDSAYYLQLYDASIY